eukprot:609682-Rhodomonas_salina.1
MGGEAESRTEGGRASSTSDMLSPHSQRQHQQRQLSSHAARRSVHTLLVAHFTRCSSLSSHAATRCSKHQRHAAH